jgi:hypothetical protein
MTFHEYNQLLKFLYFEGYAESYEEAEYIIEDLNDDEFESLCEEVFPQYTEQEIDIDEYLMTEGFNDKGEFIRDNPSTAPDRPSRPNAGRSTNKTPKPKPRKNDDNQNAEKRKELAKSILKQQESYKIVEYLVNEGFADNNESAFIILENMSEDWEYHIIQEMRKEDKVAGKKKTPIYISRTTKKAEPAPEGSGRKWDIKKTEHKTTNPVATFGRTKQGLPPTPSDYSHRYNTTSGTGNFGKVQPHGAHRNVRGAARDGTTADVVGSKRGVKKTPGQKTPPSSAGSTTYRRGAIRQSRAQREAGKGFSGWSRGR